MTRPTLALFLLMLGSASAQEIRPVLDGRKLLEAETFWDNRDWDWYLANIPFFDCPDATIRTTYYYRWELVTKHLTYGSPTSGYTFTEFMDRPFWSGTYGAISCPAGHQLYEVRWLKNPRYAREHGRYWFKTPGAQPRNYSTWLADAVWAVHRVHPDRAFVTALLPDLQANYKGWEARHFDAEAGLFWQTGHDDGMEFNINSRQTADILRGAPAYRPTLNAYLWADALAIARVADLAGESETAKLYRTKAADLKFALQARLWDPKREFFFPMSARDEERDGFKVKKGSLTYQSGKFAGSPFGRELIGYVPWQFEMLDPGFESAWKRLTDPNGFQAEFGPTVTERKDPMFLLSETCCWWSGQSWPYATTQTLKALANLLQGDPKGVVTRADYLKLLSTFAKTHRKDGRPYIAEAAHPDTGSWKGHDSYNHSEHYFHSGFNDLIITGLIGLRPGDDDTVELAPLAPEDWPYLAIDDLPYRGRRLSVIWDRDGTRYGRGKGLRILADGREIAASNRLERIKAPLPPRADVPEATPPVNFAVNNDGHYFPRISVSGGSARFPARALIDGNYWYHESPPNRWVGGEGVASDTVEVDFGVARRIDHVKLYVLDDGNALRAPTRIDLEYWNGSAWRPIPDQARAPASVVGHAANVVRFPELPLRKIRAILHHDPMSRVGLSEIEAWGPADQSLAPAPMPAGNLALNLNPSRDPYPKVTASFTSRFDKVERAINGTISFNPTPNDRWTSYESPNASDTLEIDLGRPREFSRVELAIYDDRGGVQAPEAYTLEVWDGAGWTIPAGLEKLPARPIGGEFNTVNFNPTRASKVRVTFKHAGRARSGVSEIMIWP